MSTNPLTVAVVGLGRVGWSTHFKALAANPNFKTVAIADPLEERRKEAEELSPGCVGYPDLDTLLANSDAELIVDATPTFLHESDAQKIFAAGRHCLLEKPMAFDYQGSKRIAEMAKKAGKQLFVHHQHMFMPQVHMLKSVIDSGKLGKIFSIRINWGSYRIRNDWQTLKKNGGGLLNNHGPHAFTVLTPLLNGDITDLSAFLHHAKDAGDVEDHVEIFLKTNNSQVASLLLSSAQAYPTPAYLLLGEYGSYTQQTTQSDGKIRYFDPTGIYPLEVVDGTNKARNYNFVEEPNWVEETIAMESHKPANTFHDNVFDVLRNGGEPAITVESALQVMRILTWAHTGKDPQ